MGEEATGVKHTIVRTLTEAEEEKLEAQNTRLVSAFQQMKLEKEATKNWDRFYKRNETRFFKDRHWTAREFKELAGHGHSRQSLLEVGCGVGNFFYPLLEDGLDLLVYACDVSPRAIDFVTQHPSFDKERVKPIVWDVVKEAQPTCIGEVDLVSVVFFLSAIHPHHFKPVVSTLHSCLKPGGILLFRDYAVNDMAMIRFGPGSKLGERFYVRQDGTRAYYFVKEELEELLVDAGFSVVECHYVTRNTVNRKEGLDVPRVFVQGKFQKL